jgi:hypothetical protein
VAQSQSGPLQRVFVIGASASAGFGLMNELGTNVSFAQVLDRLIVPAHEPVQETADQWFFANPKSKGRQQALAALNYEPSLVFAVDFLFWYGYGFHGDAAGRIKTLEEGLKLLAALPCPVVVSELPDMSAAVGHMLVASQVPDAATLRLINARIRSWVAAGEQRFLMPLADFVEQLNAGAAIEVCDRSWPGEVARGLLLQADRLHPTLDGLIALAVMGLDALEVEAVIQPESVRWDIDALARSIRAEHLGVATSEDGTHRDV